MQSLQGNISGRFLYQVDSSNLRFGQHNFCPSSGMPERGSRGGEDKHPSCPFKGCKGCKKLAYTEVNKLGTQAFWIAFACIRSRFSFLSQPPFPLPMPLLLYCQACFVCPKFFVPRSSCPLFFSIVL